MEKLLGTFGAGISPTRMIAEDSSRIQTAIDELKNELENNKSTLRHAINNEGYIQVFISSEVSDPNFQTKIYNYILFSLQK